MKRPSPAVLFVGRKNSGKTTLVEKLIREFCGRGLTVASIKHHGHAGFDIDIPGKDSYRHRTAGACETLIAAPGTLARIKTTETDAECDELVRSMPGYDLVLVEGYRASGLPAIELMRAGNPADEAAARLFAKHACENSDADKVTDRAADKRLPDAHTAALVSDIACACNAARAMNIPVFGFDATTPLADFIQKRFCRPCLSLVIQAGGESRRMGTDKACVSFLGRPLICRLVERLSPVADELIITTNKPKHLDFLKDKYPLLPIRLHTDLSNTRGALPGLYTALSVAKYPFVAVVACDMVCASPSLIEEELLEITRSNACAVVPQNRFGFEPFHAVYRRKESLRAVGAMLREGCTRVRPLFDRVDTYAFPVSHIREIDEAQWCFANANTPEELRTLEKLVAENE